MVALTILLVAIIAPVTLVTAFFAIEVFAGLSTRPMPYDGTNHQHVRTAIVIPAHDEQAVIGQTLAALPRNDPNLAVLVVADNCGDETAAAVATAGAQVIVRDDPDRRGKGFALAAARSFLAARPPDVVIILDADCQTDSASLNALAAAAASNQRACQAVNLLTPDLRAPAVVQISTFAFMIKNLVRQRGLQRLAGRAHLTGTGMAFPWEVFEGAELGGANIVEDLALGLDLAQRTAPPMFVESARVSSPPASAGGTLVQRRRWEGGYLATAVKQAPRAFLRSFSRFDLRGAAAALDLSVPPLSLLVVLNVVAFLLGVASIAVGVPLWPVLIQVGVAVLALLALILAWVREGRRFASGATLLRLPIYVLWKLPMYLGLVRRGTPKEWLRTGR
jgi:cellulose synthase/poly-beta-1,6-N-acetylglucosamine synthase-like glycosyltransferase